MRCDKCFNGVPVVSENGIHYNCCLNEKELLDCMIGRKDHYEENPMKKDRPDE